MLKSCKYRSLLGLIPKLVISLVAVLVLCACITTSAQNERNWILEPPTSEISAFYANPLGSDYYTEVVSTAVENSIKLLQKNTLIKIDSKFAKKIAPTPQQPFPTFTLCDGDDLNYYLVRAVRGDNTGRIKAYLSGKKIWTMHGALGKPSGVIIRTAIVICTRTDLGSGYATSFSAQ
jgi:hypothetical protein